jgi:hypothetical protein
MTVRLPCLDCHKPEAERARAEIAQVYLETAAEAAGRANAMDLLPTRYSGRAHTFIAAEDPSQLICG